MSVTDEATADRRVITCNYTEATSIASEGAKAYVATAFLGGNLPERVLVIVRSRSGRWVEKWENMRRLGNFRLKTLPPEHPRYSEHWLQGEASDEQVTRLNAAKAELSEVP